VSQAHTSPKTKPVYAFIGADPFLQSESLSALNDSLGTDFQHVEFDGEKAELSDVLDELRSFAMFGSGKLVVIREADAFISRFREPLENYLQATSDSGVLVLRVNSLPSNQRIYKLIQKVGVIEKLQPPKFAELPRWIIAQARKVHSVGVDQDAALLLAELIGDDLGRLDNEIGKLALQCEKNHIRLTDVRQGVAFQREQQMWDMTNELAAGRSDQAVRRWRQMLQMDSSVEYRAVTWLGMWLEKAQQAIAMRASGMNTFAIAGALKIWPREMQDPFMRTAERLRAVGLEHALDLLVQVDHQSKTGIGSAAGNVERFLLTMGHLLQLSK
jgi:DNA polymerase III delta subunit